VSTDNPAIMLISLIYSIILYWGYVSNSNVTMKFAQIHYFLSQNVGGDKRYYVPPCPKVGEDMSLPSPPINSVPGWSSISVSAGARIANESLAPHHNWPWSCQEVFSIGANLEIHLQQARPTRIG